MHKSTHHHLPTALAATLLLSACGGGDDNLAMLAPAEACARMAGRTVDASAIGLPTRGATVSDASLVAATATLPEHCKLTGAIAPVDANGMPINFQLNLPSSWNGKAMHFGGGGYNGSVVAATGAAPSAVPGTPVPLARGYATFGSDSGHSGGGTAFALNEEALVNFGHAQMKKTRDVAVALVQHRYGSKPARTYWVGSSQGGREGLTVAQRYPADYDGILARVPVVSFTGLQLQGNRFAQAVGQPGAWLNTAKVELLQQAVLNACDASDGLVDRTVANYAACNFAPAPLRCPGGGDAGDTCLSDAQLATVGALHSPMQYGFAVANGITLYPGWGWGGENDPAGNWTSWVTGTGGTGGNIASFGNLFVQNFIAQNAAGFDPLAFNPSDPAWRSRIAAVSETVDSTNPDLSAFRARGGKLLMQEFGGDYARSPYATFAYHDAVVARLGQAAVDDFMRLYFTPGANHSGTGGSGWTATSVDWVEVLESWVERGQAPGNMLTQVKKDTTAPFATTAVRPLCRYPLWARYNGGDVNQVGSFSCVAPG